MRKNFLSDRNRSSQLNLSDAFSASSEYMAIGVFVRDVLWIDLNSLHKLARGKLSFYEASLVWVDDMRP